MASSLVPEPRKTHGKGSLGTLLTTSNGGYKFRLVPLVCLLPCFFFLRPCPFLSIRFTIILLRSTPRKFIVSHLWNGFASHPAQSHEADDHRHREDWSAKWTPRP